MMFLFNIAIFLSLCVVLLSNSGVSHAAVATNTTAHSQGRSSGDQQPQQPQINVRKGTVARDSSTRALLPQQKKHTIVKTRDRKMNQSDTCFQKILIDKWNGGSDWLIELSKAATGLKDKNDHVVITGGDWNYRAVVMNWMAHMRALGINNYLVLCFSPNLMSIVVPWSEGGHGILVPSCSSYQEYMLMKIVALDALIRQNMVATWSDADCIWLDDLGNNWILPYKDKVDIIGQRGRIPEGLYQVAGSTICMGLVSVFPSPRSFKLFNRVMSILPNFEMACDQTLFNNALKDEGSYEFKGKVRLENISHEANVVIPELKLFKNSPVIGFLPYPAFPRTRKPEEWLLFACQGYQPRVWHVNCQKAGDAKLTEMAKHHVFALRRNWTEVRAHQEFLDIVDMSAVIYPPALENITSYPKHTFVYTFNPDGTLRHTASDTLFDGYGKVIIPKRDSRGFLIDPVPKKSKFVPPPQVALSPVAKKYELKPGLN